MNELPSLIRALIVDDTPDLRMLLRLTLERDQDIAVVGEAADGREGVRLAQTERPDLVLLDLAMPVMDGLEALPQIKRACPDAKVVVLSGFESGAMLERSRSAGADAYLQKGTSPGDILALVRRVVGAQRPAPDATPSVREMADSARPVAAPRRPPAEPTARPALVPRGPSEAALAAAPVGVLLLAGALEGAGARLAYASPMARDLLGLPGTLAGTPLDRLPTPLAGLVQRRASALRSGAITRDRVSIPGGGSVEVLMRADGVDVALSVGPVAQDEAARLRQAINTTAHEIRNPVMLLAGVAAVFEESGDSLSAAQRSGLLGAVRRQAGLLEQITEDLLTAAQAGHGTLRVDVRAVHVTPLLRDAVTDVAGSAPVAVTGATDAWVVADPGRLRQMVSNLLGNALKYGVEPYRLEVDLEPAPEAATSAGTVVIRVRDAGPGVDPAFAPHLFEEFSRQEGTSAKGTGLGLFVVRSLAEAQGGTVGYERDRAGGSVFSVRLPAAAPRQEGGRPDSV